MRDTYKAGLFSEFIARMYLRVHGFRILERRYVVGRNTGRAEIDIIARRKNLLIFVEVKYRPDLNTALGAVSAPQITRLRRSAELYLMQRRWDGDARFDIIAVMPYKIRWIRGAI